MISLSVEKRYGTATVRARVAASSVGEALELCKDARIVAVGEGARPPTDPGYAKKIPYGEPSTKMAA